MCRCSLYILLLQGPFILGRNTRWCWTERTTNWYSTNPKPRSLVDYKRKKMVTQSIFIVVEEVVSYYKYLIVHLNYRLDWRTNCKVRALLPVETQILQCMHQIAFYQSVVARTVLFAVISRIEQHPELALKLCKLFRKAGLVLGCKLDTREVVVEFTDNSKHLLHATQAKMQSFFYIVGLVCTCQVFKRLKG